MENKRIIEILFLLLIASYALLFGEDIIPAYKKVLNKIDPCPTPMAYSIGQFDTDFNLSKNDFKLIIKEAEGIWEKASKRDLFNYTDNGEMKISLIYDSRQEATFKINDLDNSLDKDNNYYLQLKAQYESLTSQYSQASQVLNSSVSSYNQRLSEYEAKVSVWNKNNGSQAEYNQLSKEKQELDSLASSIKTKQSEINSMASRINQSAEQLNALATSLNLNITRYNNVVKSTDQEFEQGNYISEFGKREINIYQFENRDKLVRVLAHELGHALGIDHVDNQEDIMHAYNVGKSINITDVDLIELEKACPK
ncbi:MAG: matrixin family metalloprotease [Candidatus Paceibacterota bacterium]